MAQYQITSRDGVDMGVFSGRTPEDAIEAMHRDAGAKSSEDMAKILGKPVEQLRAELTVQEV